jgi:uncharacterized protein YbjT (DUF2867 family)
VRDLLAPLPGASVVRPRDVDAMADALRRRIAAGREPDLTPPAAYERARCVATIAQILDDALGDPRASSLQCPVGI